MIRYLDSIHPLSIAVSRDKELGLRQDEKNQRICLDTIGMYSASCYGPGASFLREQPENLNVIIVVNVALQRFIVLCYVIIGTINPRIEGEKEVHYLCIGDCC